jgi:hypothetical protein
MRARLTAPYFGSCEFRCRQFSVIFVFFFLVVSSLFFAHVRVFFCVSLCCSLVYSFFSHGSFLTSLLGVCFIISLDFSRFLFYRCICMFIVYFVSAPRRQLVT